MQPEDRQAFAACMAGAGEYYRAAPAPRVIETYWRLLEEFPIELVSRAFTQHARDPEWGHRFPLASDLAKHIGGTASDRADDAWAKVLTAVRRHGQYSSVAFDDPLVHVVVEETGGWGALCLTGDREMPFRAREFRRRYETHLKRGVVPAHPHVLGGALAGAPVLVGDPARAAQVRDGKALALSGSGAVPSNEYSKGEQHGAV